MEKYALRRIVAVAALALALAGGVSNTARAEESDFPRYGTSYEKEKKGSVIATKYPGNLYGIKAFGRSDNLTREEAAKVSRQVMLRSAQLALENDRPYFGTFGPSNVMSEAETRYVRGTEGYTTWVGGRMNARGFPEGLQQIEVEGTPGRSYQLPQYEGQWSMVKLWTAEQAMERGPKPKDGMTDYDAEMVYRDLVGSTPGSFPSLLSIYEDLAERSERAGKNDASARAAAIRSYLKVAALRSEAGDKEDAQEAAAKAAKLEQGMPASVPRGND